MKNKINKSIPILLMLALALAAPSAFAGKKSKRKLSSAEFQIPKLFCESAKEIDKKAEGCEDNEYYVKAAEFCLEKLDSETDRVIAFHTPPGEEPKEFSDNESLKGISSEGFGYLIALNQIALREVNGYKRYLRLPEDADDEKHTAAEDNSGEDDHTPAEEKYALEVPCYGEAKDDLDGVTKDIRDDIYLFANFQAHAPAYAPHENRVAPAEDAAIAPRDDRQ